MESKKINENILMYTSPANEWEEALMLGNGRIGAMVFSKTDCEKISLNEDTLWSGFPRDTACVEDDSHFKKARALALEGKLSEAQECIEQNMTGRWSNAYLPLGDMLIDFGSDGKAENYKRTLKLREGLCTTEYSKDGACFKQEVFVSYPDDVMVVRITSSKKKAISFTLTFESQLKSESFCEDGLLKLLGECPADSMPPYVDTDNPIVYYDNDEHRGVQFLAAALVRNDGGEVSFSENSVKVSGADTAEIIFSVKTSFNGFDKHPYLQGKEYKDACVNTLKKAAEKSFDELKKLHIDDVCALYDRTDFSLNLNSKNYLPTDERLKLYENDNSDETLPELLFNFGKYLIIASSRYGTQPTNLQGIWNRHMRPPWSSNYTVNINTEMNYWPVLPCSLFECHEPLVRMLGELCTSGKKTAKTYFGARGFTAFHNTDLWRLTTPVGSKRVGSAAFAFWPMAAGWLVRHLFEEYLYTLDTDFLKNTAYPIMKESALFLYDILTEDEDGYLIACPSTSPENHFFYKGKDCAVAKTSTMTLSIIRDVFENCIKSCEVLDCDGEFKSELETALKKLAPYKIGSNGQLLEWDSEYEEVEIHHRHTSHLYSLHPAHYITPVKTPELAEACRHSLEIRGDDGTGWSLGWKINHWARLKDGNHALKLIKRQLRFVDVYAELYNGGGTYANMFDAHPPFQIDGNFGATAGICEMLTQSDGETIELLPALPDEWTEGHINGISARGAVKLDIQWKDRKLISAAAYASADTCVTVRYGEKSETLKLKKGEKADLKSLI